MCSREHITSYKMPKGAKRNHQNPESLESLTRGVCITLLLLLCRYLSSHIQTHTHTEPCIRALNYSNWLRTSRHGATVLREVFCEVIRKSDSDHRCV